MGCGICKSSSCEEKIVEHEAATTSIRVSQPAQIATENWQCEHRKLFIVNEEPSSLEESAQTFRLLDPRAKLRSNMS